MPTARDTNFAEAVVEEGLVSKDKVDECLAEMKHAESIGATVTLDAVLVKKGLITRDKADAILEALVRKKVPRRIAGFEILETIGRGGMHTVFKARQVSMDRIVALKVLSPRLAANKRYIERLFKEARSVAMLSHVNIIQGYDVGEASGYFYFASEYVDGESVAAKLAREGKIGETEALNIIEQVALALAHIHSAVNMIHGDIKPGNIILTKAGVAKLADLGLARLIGEVDTASAGTPHYISPEQARGNVDMDIRSDIYSLGATLFHVVTGVPPYAGATNQAIIAKHFTAPIPSPRILAPELSAGLCTMITTMLAKNRDERYQTPDELLQDIRTVRAGLPLKLAPRRKSSAAPQPAQIPEVRFTGAPYRPPVKTKSKWMIPAIAGGAALVVLAAVLIVIATRWGRQPEPPPVAAGPQQQKEADPVVARAEEDLLAVQNFEKTNPNEMSRIVAAYEELAASYASTPSGQLARQKAAALKQRWETESKTEFDRVKAEANKLAEEEKYSKAIDAFRRYPERLSSDKWRKAVADEIAKLKKKAGERTAEILKQADALAKKKQFKEAAKALEAARSFGFDNVNKLIAEKAAEYEKSQDERVETVAKHAEEEFSTLLKTVARYERNYSYSLALQECERYLKQYDGNAEAAGEATYLKAEVENARDTWKEVAGALAKAAGEPIELRVAGIRMNGKVVKASADSFTIDANNARLTRQLYDIDLEDALQLAGMRGADDASTERRAMFLLASGEPDKAGEAVKTIADAAKLTAWKDRIAQREELVRVDPNDAKAQSALEGLHKWVDAKDWKTLFLGLSRYRQNYGKTMAFAASQDEYDALSRQAEAGLCKLLNIADYNEGDFIALLNKLRDFSRWQKENKCPKTVPCVGCDGKGYTVVRETCPTCYGRRTVRCQACSGRGRIYGWVNVQCSVCLGTGRARCPTCRGTGVSGRRQVCIECAGGKTNICPKCQGYGYKEQIPEEFANVEQDLKERCPRQFDAIMTLIKEPD